VEATSLEVGPKKLGSDSSHPSLSPTMTALSRVRMPVSCTNAPFQWFA